MGQPAAPKGDKNIAIGTQILLAPSSIGPFPTLFPHNGTLGSPVQNIHPNIPQGDSFQKPPTNRTTIIRGCQTVRINGKPAARNGDTSFNGTIR